MILISSSRNRSSLIIFLLIFVIIFSFLATSGHSYQLWDWRERQRRRLERHSKRLAVNENEIINDEHINKDNNEESLPTLNVSSKDSPYALIDQFFPERELNHQFMERHFQEKLKNGTVVNAQDLGNLKPKEVWLSDGDLLVLRGGATPNRKAFDPPWKPLDDYVAPYREPKLPPPDFIPSDTGVGVALPPEDSEHKVAANPIFKDFLFDEEKFINEMENFHSERRAEFLNLVEVPRPPKMAKKAALTATPRGLFEPTTIENFNLEELPRPLFDIDPPPLNPFGNLARATPPLSTTTAAPFTNFRSTENHHEDSSVEDEPSFPTTTATPSFFVSTTTPHSFSYSYQQQSQQRPPVHMEGFFEGINKVPSLARSTTTAPTTTITTTTTEASTTIVKSLEPRQRAPKNYYFATNYHNSPEDFGQKKEDVNNEIDIDNKVAEERHDHFYAKVWPPPVPLRQRRKSLLFNNQGPTLASAVISSLQPRPLTSRFGHNRPPPVKSVNLGRRSSGDHRYVSFYRGNVGGHSWGYSYRL